MEVLKGYPFDRSAKIFIGEGKMQSIMETKDLKEFVEKTKDRYIVITIDDGGNTVLQSINERPLSKGSFRSN